MPAENKKITDLDLNIPSRDHNFVVATEQSNFRLRFGDVAEHSSVDVQSGIFLDTLTISGVNVATGDFTKLEDMFEDLSGYVDDVSGNVDVLSGNLHETGQILEGKIEAIPDTFVFFSDVYNNDGPIEKTYYETPTPDIYLSGITVNLANDLKTSLQWDGPFDGYAGTGYVNDIPIPIQNCEQLGDNTRRFEGHIDNLDALGTTVITGVANGDSPRGVTGYITVEEVGPDPFAESITLDEIANATAVFGQVVGTDALKAGDTLNVFVQFDPAKVVDSRQTITGIQVADSGISNGIDWFPYNPTTIGGLEQIVIPVTISNRNGDHGVAIRASNEFGATGDYAVSNIHFVGFDDSRLLDQLYPIINVSSDGPTNYNGRLDGLREGETALLPNTIDQWDILRDSVEYEFLSINGTNVLISNPNTFENPKLLTYNAGIYVNAGNLKITATRHFNGSVTQETSRVKVANAPVIESINIQTPAISAVAPHLIGTSAVKGGDVVRTIVRVDTQGSDPDEIEISVSDIGAAGGLQGVFLKRWTGSPNPIGGDIFEYTVDVTITDKISRNGMQSITMSAGNEYNTLGDSFTSVMEVEVDNTFPTVTIDDVVYPAGQQAIKAGDLADLVTTANDFDEVEYTQSDNINPAQIDIADPDVYSASKPCGYLAGGYNVTEDNIKIKVIKTSNGYSASDTSRINIADDPITLTMIGLPQKLLSSPNGEFYRFTMESDQLFNDIPSLDTSNTQTEQSILVNVSQGVGTSSNVFDIMVDDLDTKGSFPFVVSAFNLANIETTTSTPPEYNVEGFVAREIEAHPNDLFAGIAEIGTTVTNPANVTFENLSEAGHGPNGGTEYSFDASIIAQVEFDADKDDQFFVCDSDGSPLNNGSFVFNLDALSRAANADVRHPARFLVKED